MGKNQNWNVQVTRSSHDFRALIEQRTGSWFRAEVDDTAESEVSSASLYIYDVVGWDPYPADLGVALEGLDVELLNVYVNSPGGYAYDGIAIYNLLRRHKARVVVTVEGLAASAASVIAMAGDEVVMATGSQMMIHDPWAFGSGNQADFEVLAAHLGKLGSSIADIYQAKAGGSAEDWRAAMSAESWYSAQEAVDAGLADRTVAAEADEVADAAAKFDLRVFSHAGRDCAPAPLFPAAMAGSPSPAGVRAGNQPKEKDMATLDQGVRERLGISASTEIDEDGLLAALDEALTERLEPVTFQPPAGTAVIDEGTLAQLQADAAAGRQAREEQLVAHRNGLVDGAVADGRIPPSRAEHWRALLAADPGASEVLAALPAGTVPVHPVGETGGVDEAADEDTRIYNKIFPNQEG